MHRRSVILPTAMAPNQRPMQDFRAWKSFGTARLWEEIGATPNLAVELLAQHINHLGGINLSEPSSASIAAAAIVAMHGPGGCTTLADDEIDNVYKQVKASICYANM